jgi:predicted DNA-binding transcriptional regulator YafY
MGRKLAYERYHWFYGQIKAGKYPNAKKLSEKFEISHKQAQRDVEFMRDRLEAPLAYDPMNRGYALEDDSYVLPPVWFSEDELLALCLALRLASTLPDRQLKSSLLKLLEKFLTYRFLEEPPRIADIQEKISVKNVEYAKVEGTIFHRIMDALFRDESVRIVYHNPHKHETSERAIRPLHLLCYMGSWHLIAFCSVKGEVRDFALSRIRSIESVAAPVILPEQIPSIKDFIRRDFGLLVGKGSVEVCLRFSPEVSEWVSEQIWHSGQEVLVNEDGSVCLTFPVADFREVRREILRHGADVEVLSPPELREEVKKEIEKMGKIYR